jgi:hypothetical protein
MQQNNGIPIKSWYEDKDDRELFNLLPVLKNLSGFYDIRTEIPKFICNNTLIWHKAVEWVEENYVAMPYSNPKTNAASTIRSSRKNLLSPVSEASQISPNRTIIYDSIDADGETAYEMVDTENYDREKINEREMISPSLLSNSNININIINGNFNKYVYTNKNSPCKKLSVPLETDEDIYRPINTEDNLITGTKSLTQNILQGLKTTSNNLLNSNKKVELHYFNKKKKSNMSYAGHYASNNINILEEPNINSANLNFNWSKEKNRDKDKERDRDRDGDLPHRLNTDSMYLINDEVNYYQTQTQSSVSNNNHNTNNSSIMNNKTYVSLNTCPNTHSNHNTHHTHNPIHVKKNIGAINLYKVKNNFSSFIKNINEVPHNLTHNKSNNNNRTPTLTNLTQGNSNNNNNNNYTGINYSIIGSINNSITNSSSKPNNPNHNSSSLIAIGKNPVLAKSLITTNNKHTPTSYINYLTAGNNYKNKTRNIISTSSNTNNNNKSSKNESVGIEANSMNRRGTPVNIHSLKNKSVVYTSGRNNMNTNSSGISNTTLQKIFNNLNVSKERENSNSQNHHGNNLSNNYTTSPTAQYSANSENLLRYSANSNISSSLINTNTNTNTNCSNSNLKPKVASQKLEELRKMYNEKLIESIKNRTNKKLIQQSQVQGSNHNKLKKSPSINKGTNSRSKSDLFTSYENTNNINNQSKRENLFSAVGEKRGPVVKTLNRLNSFNINTSENLLTYSTNLKSSIPHHPTTPTHINKSASKEISSPNYKNSTLSIRDRLMNLKYQSKNFNDYLVKMRNVYGLKKDESTNTGNTGNTNTVSNNTKLK